MQAFHQIDYHSRPAFSGFLPGIAGLHGIPMWVFYVNRGQGVVSFGVDSKDGSIAEFFSAANAYRVVSERGFRTFLKDSAATGAAETQVYEPFSGQVPGAQSEFIVNADTVSLCERNEARKLQVEVSYRTMPHRATAALVREVTLTNLSNTRRTIEYIDGLPALIPAGIDHSALKNIATTAQAWIRSKPVERNAAVYRVSATLGDTADVKRVERVHFAAGFLHGGGSTGGQMQVVYDPDIVFQPQGAFRLSSHFACARVEELLLRPQSDRGKTPSALFAGRVDIAPGAAVRLVEVYGAAETEDAFRAIHTDLAREDFASETAVANREIVEDIASLCATETALPDFDAYCRQSFIDNVLRGGLPYVEHTPAGDVYLPVYSRKHGDLERDYNWFVIPPEYYSQGWGNYRDVLQNRRSDVFFVPRVGMENLWEFVSLIQTDGYNPLSVQGRSFSLPEASHGMIPESMTATRALVSSGEFSPGTLLRSIERDGTARNEARTLFATVLGACEAIVNAEHGEGFWIDHWDYINDLLENCLSVFADQAERLLWDEPVYPYYRSGHFVLPRCRKWAVVDGTVRQYKAVDEPAEADAETDCWMHDASGTVFKASLGEKLLGLVAVKFLTRDAFGVGVEMEAGKPGWYDALNGLPGLLGSSLPESWELLRLLRTLSAAVASARRAEFSLADEVARLFETIRSVLGMPAETDTDLHARWDRMAGARETYREETRNGFSGGRQALQRDELAVLLQGMQDDVQAGLRRGRDRTGLAYPTYLVVAPNDTPELHHFLAEGDGGSKLSFDLRPLPLFLEGMVKALSVETDPAERARIHETVMESDLYDRKLKMLRVNAPLENEPHEIGRARAFTPGWLENGSIWLHMEYKYLLALLHAGMYSEFWTIAKTALVPFMDPDVYGRSIHENSSFIASSLHPDASLHGRGFVARLSGSTAEFVSIWAGMFFGLRFFRLDGDALQAVFEPFIPGELFDESGRVRCHFMHRTSLTYVNPARITVIPGGPVQPAGLSLTLKDDNQRVEIIGNTLPPPYAGMLRDGGISAIEITIGGGT
ncbi:MAG: hypothetical protein EA383_08565 [Spirochaetaceae bacterium]|nr:MAG: hypothetical protein EA383_08565 [Spirochaetaceae bacterium]